MVVRQTSSQLSVSTTTSKRSLYPPSVLSAGWDADDEDSMSMSPNEPEASRPLSVAIPRSDARTRVPTVHGPYCPRRPGLREILANTAVAPWTLAAFMAYLSNNHCLETLEFTMDAGRYKKHFAKMMSRAGSDGLPPAKDCEYVQALWHRLVDAYIRPNGSREVNLPSDVRDPILNLRTGDLPPTPEKLDPAVAKIYELMEESVLVPFLNSVYPQTAHPTISSYPLNTSDESIPMTARTYEDHSTFRYPIRSMRSPSPPQSAVEPHAYSYSPPSALNRVSAPTTLPSSLSSKARQSAKLSPTRTETNWSSASGSGGASDVNVPGSYTSAVPGMVTDDSGGSTDSPIYDSPQTPPMSPPTSDAGALHGSPKRDSGMWKKLGRLSKVGKKKSAGGLQEER